MVEKQLGEGEVQALITTGNTKYLVTRKVGEEQVILRNGTPIEKLIFEDIFPVVVFSETEIEDTARMYQSQLVLIDKFVEDSDELKRSVSMARSELVRNKELIQDLEQRIEQSNEKLADLPTIKENIQSFDDHDFETRLELSNLCVVENSLMTSITDIYDTIIQYHNLDDKYSLLEQIKKGLDVDYIDELPNKKQIKDEINRINRVIKTSKNKVSRIINYIDENVKEFNTKKELIYKDHEDKKNKIEEILAELNSDENEAAETYISLKTRESELTQIETNLLLLQSQLEDEVKNRVKCIRNLKTELRNLYNARLKQASILSEQLGELININIEKNAQMDNYIDFLDDYLKGTRTYQPEKQNIVNNYNPFELYDVIIAKRKEEFMEKTKISKDKTEKIFNHHELHDHLYDLQNIDLPDKPIIQLKVGSNYKPIYELSLGQRCTTILSILLLQSKIPLILDTPEQGLDNIFIYESVVQTLRKIKEKRQIIIATHDANIPVSGDSELILCFESDGNSGKIQCRGSIDNEEMKQTVQKVLEGGEAAFKFRMEKYRYK